MCIHYLRLRAELAAARAAAERAEALRARLQKVERDQAVWVLAAAVLHELNNPLHALGLLLDELDSSIGDASESRALLGRARAQAERAFSQLEMLRSMRSTGEPELQRVALDGIVDTLTTDLESLGAEDGVSVRMECVEPVFANGDPAYIRTILENLVDNSLHAVRANGGRTVVLKLATEHDRAIVRVSDDGPPLPSDVRAALFEPLRSTKPHGLGLGLPIARALARAMRGDLSFDDEHGKVFRLELPLRGSA
jgi:signal transduction histidine kinase